MYSLNEPVRSEATGFKRQFARKFATLDVILRFKSQPWTPPPGRYLVPVTISALVAFYFAINSVMNLGW